MYELELFFLSFLNQNRFTLLLEIILYLIQRVFQTRFLCSALAITTKFRAV